MSVILNFTNFTELVPLVSGSILAGVVLGVLAGLIGPMIHARDLAFAVHGTSELSFAGASVALFFGLSVTSGAVVGSLVAAVILGLLGVRAKDRNASIGIMLPFGMGIGVLFLSLYKGRSSNKFGLLTGQIVAVDGTQLTTLCLVAGLVALALAMIWRPLFFASADPAVAKARGVPMRTLSIVFMVLLGLTTAMAIQLVGALLVLSLLITPTAAAARVTARPTTLSLLSIAFAVTAAVGGILLSLGPGLPISPYVTTISFVIYLICLPIGALRRRLGWSRRG
ncbi:metal ABC transporter permease [Acidipropionibacterium jensenii]|uniref:Metal ABC transporter permease n=1 Tax=Acidipropionibacterium jensenii TaxID=1749 RepID=A0A3T0S398_9ACTN|nr:metal ABC transporter permease [Acidipropionibacterium jensenii]AZZ40819.1 metal ABC transporter permease [Acidipropionibacterium jensenii]MDN5976233.1 metal ABC transporter permease [Acidipropionibacterium jensenii]MDN5995491.1 metal ABC transporter permease [Acidipropionibacterium jensenii]MDN6020596.1 metal ABC transporter permease [Acidipropionibacterium jensenii]MDN6426569.1 metal ABC transporter permease [Acidipropionibacterium jensenii]